jgi:hypothetical protein
MDPQPAFSFQELFTYVIGDMAKALAERTGETPDQHFIRSKAAAHMILGFLPRDVTEVMLAGHCVMLHEFMLANAVSTLRGDADPKGRGPRSNIVGLNKAFNDNLDRLERYRRRPAEGTRDGPEAATHAPPDQAGSPPPARGATSPAQQSVSLAHAVHPQPFAHAPNRAAKRQAARAESRAAAMAWRAAAKQANVAPNPGAQSPTASFAGTRAAPASPEPAAEPSASPEAIAACAGANDMRRHKD